MGETRVGRGTSLIAVVLLVLAGAVAIVTLQAHRAQAATTAVGPGAVQQPGSSVVTADALPTAQIDGVAWKQVIVGDTVFVGGSFSKARPAGTSAGDPAEVARTDLLSYTLSTGVLNDFAPVLDGQVYNLAVSPDQTTLYVVGDFTHVNGLTRNRVAAFTIATGALTSFNGGTNGTTYAVVATNSTVYVGGLFNTANGSTRSRLAAFTTDGTLTGWAPSADYKVNDMVLTPSGTKVVLAGGFTTINGNNVYGIAAVDATTGASVPWATNGTVQSYGTAAAFTSITSDGTAMYVTSFNFHGTGNIEGTVSVDPETGTVNWLEDCHGDTYGAFAVNGAVYTVSHAHYCGNLNGWPDYNPRQWRRTVAFTHDATGTLPHDTTGYPDHYGLPSPSIINWFPDMTTGTATGQGQAAWTVTGNSQYIVEGGEFPSVNGIAQQGLVRFATRAVLTKKQIASGPKTTSATFFPTLTSPAPGQVRIAIQSVYDRDSQVLTYSIVRNDATTVWSGTVISHWWSRPMIGFVDSGQPAGTPVSYHVTVTDPDGHTVTGADVSITPGSTTAATSFDQQMINDGATNYWPLNEASGSTVYDAAGFDDLDAGTGVTRGTAGPFSGESASSFSGGSNGNGVVIGRSSIPAPNTVSVSAWVKTTTTSGGRIVGLGNNPTSVSTTDDRMLYLDNNGKVYFGILNSAFQKTTIASSAAINNGSWHQVVGTYGNNSMSLWVDGLLVAQRTDVPPANPGYNGWWRIGGDGLSGWTNAPSSNYLNGSIASVAVFPTILSRVQVQGEFRASGRTLNVPAAPGDSFGQTVYGDDPAFYYRLNETSGTVANDAGAYGNNGKYSGGYTQGAAAAVAPGTAVTFNGSTGTVGSGRSVANPLQYSTEAWFKTTTTKGGKIIGFGNAQTGSSAAGTEDRHVYMLNTGQLAFGALSGSTKITVQSPNTYNDGNWHQVVATQGSTGMSLYVDGQLVGSNANTAAGKYTGFWRIGGDANPWSGSTSGYFAGTIDEVSEYSYVLSSARVAAHYRASPTAGPLPPSATFTVTQNGATVNLDATGSSDPDGTITSYDWDFGDGSTGSGATTSHIYGSSASYTVTLTVTDDDGNTATATQTVNVAASPTGAVSATAAGSPSGGKYRQIAVVANVSGLPANTVCQVFVGGDGADQTDEQATVTGQTDNDGDLAVSATVADAQGRGYVWTVGTSYFWNLSCSSFTGTLQLSPAGTSGGVPGAYVGLTPYRVLDTRTGNGGLRPGAKSTVSVQVAGRGGVPATGVSAVVLTVTATGSTAGGFVTAYTHGIVRPGASTLNFARGQTVPNVAVVPIGSDGKVSLYNGSTGRTDLIADVSGYYLSGSASNPGAYVPVPSARLLDTRTQSPVGASSSLPLVVAGRGGVPASGVSAVVVNVTVTGPTGNGFVTAYPDGVSRPTASSLNFVKGRTVANLVVVQLGADGRIALYNGSAGKTHLIVDVAGYYLAGTPSASGTFTSLAPTRLLDTRINQGGSAPAATGTVSLQVTGVGGVPSAAQVSAVVLNVTVTRPEKGGFLAAYGAGQNRPVASNINFVPGQTVAGLVVVRVGAGGKVNLYNGSGGTTQLLADVAGYVLK